MKVIVVIPARGGSKGIPRKSIRPVAGKPMIYYAITAAKYAKLVNRVVVSTDDSEIGLLSERFGAAVITRSKELAEDTITLDPVICSAVMQAEHQYSERYDIVITVQPTSPLITSFEIDDAIEKLVRERSDSIVSVVDDRHLCWTVDDAGKCVPEYHARVNRQQLPARYKETGAIIGCTRSQLDIGTRIGSNISLLEVPHEKSFDIDSFSDLYLCESILQRKKIIFVVAGYPEIGLGHAYRAIVLASELVKYDVEFICSSKSDLAKRYIEKYNYTVYQYEEKEILEKIVSHNPDLVINDILDTKKEYIKSLKDRDIKVVNFEDLGPGANTADLVINALYPHTPECENILVGHQYFCLRDEFLFLPEQDKTVDSVKNILVTFGGVDEGDLTHRVVRLLMEEISEENDINITIVVGPGYSHFDGLERLLNRNRKENLALRLVKATQRISDFMLESDLCITSGGRTVLEVCAIGIPTIVICQNERETTHQLASADNGIVNLGSRHHVTDSELSRTINNLLLNHDERKKLVELQKSLDLRSGKKRVIERIVNLIESKGG